MLYGVPEVMIKRPPMCGQLGVERSRDSFWRLRWSPLESVGAVGPGIAPAEPFSTMGFTPRPPKVGPDS